MSQIIKILRYQNYKNIIYRKLSSYVNKLPTSPALNCQVTSNARTNASFNIREFRTWSPAFSEEGTEVAEVAEGNGEQETKPAVDPRKDRSRVIDPETSIRYMKSEAYKTTYGDEPVWVKYRRNFKGALIPRETRKRCIRGGVITCGSPCPICRDEYLVVDYRNVDLLKQFISPYTGELMDSRQIHVCRMKLMELEVEIKKAKFYGYLTYQVPFRKYDYKDYYTNYKES